MLVTLREVLEPARREKYAVGLFNTTDTDMLDAAIGAAEELRSPIIIGTAEVLLRYGDLALLAPALVSAARRASVPVVVHYDHGLTLKRVREALELGFSSVMYDASSKDLRENCEETAEAARLAHLYGATIEGEVGHVGQAGADYQYDADQHTTVDDAERFVRATGVDAVAIAVGTAHGAYTATPKLNLGRVEEIRARLDSPLVLHGGSGLSDEQFRRAIESGIAKINVFTDLCQAGDEAMRTAVAEHLSYLDARNLKVARIRSAVMNKMRIFGCAGRV